MATPIASQILVALGGRTLTQLGTVPWRKGLVTRGGEIAYTFTRADATTCATYIDYDGIIRPSLANLLRIEWVDLDGDGIRETPSLLLEGTTRTNVVLWNRDMTNAAWVKTTMTAAKDQTGVDGVTNSASSLLATAGNATCLQAIVLGSSIRAQAVWAKRLVGSGTINMTMDNGATWTAITLTTSWTRLTIPTQTLANPTVGFRIVTNTDKIAVDYVQNENAITGVLESSSLATTTAAVTRAADLLTIPFNFGQLAMWGYVKFIERGIVPGGTAGPVKWGSASPFSRWDTVGSVYRYSNQQTTGASFSSLGAAPTSGQTVELLSLLYADGSVEAIQSINGAAFTTGGRSAVQALTTNWNNQTLTVGADGWFGQIVALIIGRGSSVTLADVRAIPL